VKTFRIVAVLAVVATGAFLVAAGVGWSHGPHGRSEDGGGKMCAQMRTTSSAKTGGKGFSCGCPPVVRQTSAAAHSRPTLFVCGCMARQTSSVAHRRPRGDDVVVVGCPPRPCPMTPGGDQYGPGGSQYGPGGHQYGGKGCPPGLLKPKHVQHVHAKRGHARRRSDR
jgi:hypothetical protein